MTKRPAEKSIGKEMYLLLFSERLNQPLAPPIIKKGSIAQFNITIPFVPRFCGYVGTKAPKPDIIRIYYVTELPNGEYSARKKMGEYDFSTVDLDEILPSLETAKLEAVEESEGEKEEPEEAVDSHESSEYGQSSESQKSSSENDDPKDGNYKDMSVPERIAACTEDTIYWHPDQAHWEFTFPIVRDPPHLQCRQLKFTIVKKKKA